MDDSTRLHKRFLLVGRSYVDDVVPRTANFNGDPAWPEIISAHLKATDLLLVKRLNMALTPIRHFELALNDHISAVELG